MILAYGREKMKGKESVRRKAKISSTQEKKWKDIKVQFMRCSIRIIAFKNVEKEGRRRRNLYIYRDGKMTKG